MREHIRKVMTSSAEMFEYVIRWLAWAVQHPDERAEVSVVFKGGKGVGKGTLGNAMCRIFGQHAVHISNSKIFDRLQRASSRCQLLFCRRGLLAGRQSGGR